MVSSLPDFVRKYSVTSSDSDARTSFVSSPIVYRPDFYRSYFVNFAGSAPVIRLITRISARIIPVIPIA